ncbi:MAG: long-chain fatty acid--CoA ligase [Candidatus Omnitrophica bacterium]|nr:long-chain fatty acid--CoA ligase [Candidatus Omnitrophota bacterium]
MLISERLEESIRNYPSKTALFAGSEEATFAALQQKIHNVAYGLSNQGLNPEERVGILLPNSLEFVYSYFGILKANGIAVPLNILLKGEELKYILVNSSTRFLITSAEFLPLINSIKDALPDLKSIIVKSAGVSMADAEPPMNQWRVNIFSLDDWLSQKNEFSAKPARKEDDTAVIIYTSGTTGRPKGAMLTHRNLVFDAEASAKMLLFKKDEVFLCVLPLFHAFSATASMLLPLFSGASVVILPRFNPLETLQVISARRVTIFAGVPSMYAVWAQMEIPELDLSNWRLCISGGAALPIEVMKKFEERFKVPICEGDGPTECSPVTSCNPPEGIRKPGSIGIPLPGVEMKIVNEAGKELPIGETGEIAVRGLNVMKGYWKNPEATAETIKDGWLYTGDLGKKDEDGYFYIVDRKKDMVITGGMNVYPREVEETLYRHPKVKEAAVIGIIDRLRGEVPKAFILLKEGEAATPREIIDFCKERLADYKIPRQVEFVASFPRTASGKILKRLLK